MSVEFNSSLGQVDVDYLNPIAADENLKMRPYGDEPSGCGQMCRRPSKTAAVCLGLLCLLLLGGIISLHVHNTKVAGLHDSEMRDIQTKFNNLTSKQKELQNNYSNLTKDRKLLETKYNNLTRERDQLQISYDTLTELRDDSETRRTSLRKERDDLKNEKIQLRAEKEELQRRFELVAASRDGIQEEFNMLSLNMTEKPCRQEWTKFNGSCYYVSTSSKTWDQSRKDCEDRGANLVIIDNRKEIDFITRFNSRTWIGLSDTEREGKWTWVDGTDLVGAGFWRNGEPNDADDGEDCAELARNGKGWNDVPCSNKYSWVCEE